MQISDRRRKLIWVSAVVLTILYFGPNILRLGGQLVAAHRQREALLAAEAKPSPVHVAPPVVVQVPTDAIDPQITRMQGDWLGGGLMPNRGFCKLAFQLKPVLLKPGSFNGYSTFSCGPSLVLLGKKQSPQAQTNDLLRQITPISTIMTGTVKGRDIQFQVDQNIGETPEGCKPTAFKATPFGDQLAIEWKEGACEGGNMILQRI